MTHEIMTYKDSAAVNFDLFFVFMRHRHIFNLITINTVHPLHTILIRLFDPAVIPDAQDQYVNVG